MTHAPTVRVMFLLSWLQGGGAERIVLTLLQHLDRNEFDPKIGVLRDGGPYAAMVDPADVMLPKLGRGWVDYTKPVAPGRLIAAVPLAPLQQLSLMRTFRPHVVMSVTKSMNIAAFAAVRLYGRRKVAWVAREGNNTMAMIDHESPGRAVRMGNRTAVGVTYRGADRVLAISEGVARGLTDKFSLPRDRVSVVYNPIDIEGIGRLARANDCPEPPGFVLAAGRLEPQKGFDLLVRAFATAFAGSGVRVVILGEGAELDALRGLAAGLGIADRVLFPGFVTNPWAYMARASMFVLPSRWEGFANVVPEAMACGTPVIVSDCEYGPKEIVQDGHSGIIVRTEDVEQLAAAMGALHASAAERDRLARNGSVRARDFDVATIVPRYQDIFRDLAVRTRH